MPDRQLLRDLAAAVRCAPAWAVVAVVRRVNPRYRAAIRRSDSYDPKGPTSPVDDALARLQRKDRCD